MINLPSSKIASGSLRVVLYSVMLLLFTVVLPEGIFRMLVRKYGQFERLVPLAEADRGR